MKMHLKEIPEEAFETAKWDTYYYHKVRLYARRLYCNDKFIEEPCVEYEGKAMKRPTDIAQQHELYKAALAKLSAPTLYRHMGPEDRKRAEELKLVPVIQKVENELPIQSH